MTIYRVKTGYTFGKDNQYGPGDKIELSVEEASGFLDKLGMLDDGLSASDDDQDSGSASTGSADDKLNTIEPWRGLDAKVVLALEAGGVSPAMVPTMADDDLLTISGIGAASLKKIRSAFDG